MGRGDRKIMEAQSESREVDRLNFSVEIPVPFGRRQLAIHVGLRTRQLPVLNPRFYPFKALIDRGVTVGIGVPRMFAPHPARLQLNRQATFIGDVVQPMTELM